MTLDRTTDVEHVEVVTTVRSRLGELGSAWDRLVAAGHSSPFLYSVWVDGSAGPDTRIVVCERDGELVGGFPFEVTRRWGLTRLQVSGAVLAPDHLDLVARQDCAEAVTRRIGEWVVSTGPDRIELDGVRPGSALATMVPGLRAVATDVAPWADLSNGVDAYWAARSGRFRKGVRQSGRRLEEAGVQFHIVAPTDARRAIDEFERLHNQRFGDASVVQPVLDRFSAACRAGLESGLMTAFQLSVADQVIAIELAFDIDGVLSLYQAGRDPDRRWSGSGVVLTSKAIHHAGERSAARVDFLRGAESYKADWSDHQAVIETVSSMPTTPQRIAEGLKSAARPLSRRVRRSRSHPGSRSNVGA